MKINNVLRISWMYYLRNSGFSAAIRVIIVTLDQCVGSVENAFLNESINSLKAKMSEVDKLKYKSRKHDVTITLEAYRQTRLQILSEIKRNLNDFRRSRYVENSVPGQLLYDWFKGRTPQINESAQFEISGYINAIEEDLSQDSKISAAVDFLEMKRIFEDLFEIENLYRELFSKRGIDWGEDNDPIVDSLAIRGDAIQAVSILFSAIKALVIKEGIEKHSVMLLALQKNLEPFRATVKKRQNAKKSEIFSEETPEIEISDNTDITIDGSEILKSA